MSAEIIADPQNNNKKCGPQGSPLRVFDLRGSSATEAKCKEECMKNDLCVAFSAKWSKWCIGCKVELSQQTVSPGDQGAIAFKKHKKPGILIMFTISHSHFHINFSSLKHSYYKK